MLIKDYKTSLKVALGFLFKDYEFDLSRFISKFKNYEFDLSRFISK